MDEVTRRMQLEPRVVASNRVQRGRTEIMSSEDRWALVGAANKLAERGQIQIIRRDPVFNEQTGRHEVIVRRLRDPRPRWFWPAVIGGAFLAALAGLVGMGLWAYWITGTFSGAALTIFIGTALAIWVVSVLNRPRGRRGAVEVNVSVRVR